MNTIIDSSKTVSMKPLFNKEFVNRVKNAEKFSTDVQIAKPAIETEQDLKEFEEVLEVANEVFFGSEYHYEFQVHEKTGTVVSKLVNTDSGETVREIPSEKILDMIAGLWEIAGVIIDDLA